MCPHTRAIPSLLCLFLCSVLFGCSDTVLIQVEGRPENTRALRVSATLDGVGISQAPLLLTPAPSRVVLKDLPNPQGELEVRIEALVDQCIVASGSARLQVSLPSLQWTVASVHLDPLSPKHCPVAVELHGITANLTLTAQPPARFDCPHEAVGFRRCQAYFPVGQQAQISLQGAPEGAFIHRSYPHQASDPPQALPYSVPVEEIQEEPQRDLDQAPPNTLVLRIVNTQLPAGYAITGLWGTREVAPVADSSFAYEHLWAVGDSGHGGFIAELAQDGVLHPVHETPARLNAISGRYATDKKTPTLWAIGDRGTILRKQERQGSWEDLTTRSANQTGGKNLNALWIDQRTGDTWMVGDDATVLRSSDGGSQLSPVGAGQFASNEPLVYIGHLSNGKFVMGSRPPSEDPSRYPSFLIAPLVSQGMTEQMDPFVPIEKTNDPLVAAVESDIGIFLCTTRQVIAHPAFEPASAFGPRTSLWSGKGHRIWSGATALEYLDRNAVPPQFTAIESSRSGLKYPIAGGLAVVNSPFFMDIWVVEATVIGGFSRNFLHPLYGP